MNTRARADMSDTPRTEALIEACIARFPGESDRASLRYFQAVHQDLAPFARQLERELADMTDDYMRRHKDATDRYERIVELERDLAAAQARIAELEKDAARYRWLRERFFSHWATYRDDVVAASVAMVGVDYPRVYGKIGDHKPQFDIDAAIDAARGGADAPSAQGQRATALSAEPHGLAGENNDGGAA